jgi:hypothetical protein
MAKELMYTPRGAARYPWLNDADTKFGDPVYKTDLLCEENDSANLTAKLEDMLNAYFEDVLEREGGTTQYKEIFKDDLPFYSEDGKVIFRLKLNKLGKNKKSGETWENKVSFFDGVNAAFMPEGKRPKVGGGSTIGCSFEPNLWTIPVVEGRGKDKTTSLKVGISLRLKGVQVIVPRQGAGNEAAGGAGFSGDASGYQYDPEAFDSDGANGTDADASGF